MHTANWPKVSQIDASWHQLTEVAFWVPFLTIVLSRNKTELLTASCETRRSYWLFISLSGKISGAVRLPLTCPSIGEKPSKRMTEYFLAAHCSGDGYEKETKTCLWACTDERGTKPVHRNQAPHSYVPSFLPPPHIIKRDSDCHYKVTIVPLNAENNRCVPLSPWPGDHMFLRFYGIHTSHFILHTSYLIPCH